jgi:8-oxo-dGTP pyrophosphatase MutT (NUDIX family)
MSDDGPVFGRPSGELPLVPRPGAYAIALDESGLLAVVLARGGPHLPGGGQDPGESLEQTLVREVREEIAHDAAVGACVGSASVHADSPEEGACFLKQGTFFLVTVGAPVEGVTPEHELVWMPPAQFARESPDPSHVWALRRALD